MSESDDLQFEHESDILIVRAYGRYLVEHMEAAVSKIAQAMAQRPIKAALVDLRGLTGEITFMDRYKIGKLTGSSLRKVPIAAVASAEQLDQERIGVVVARNRGANVELFADLLEAKAWLDSIPPSENSLPTD